MIKQLFILLFFVCSLQSFSQKLVYKSNGTILNSENQKISPDQVRELLKNNQQLLADYNAGRTKKTVGNVMLYGGLGLAVGGFVYETYKGNQGITYNTSTNTFESYQGNQYLKSIIGACIIIASIPIKMGFSKKIENVVSDYNNSLKVGNNEFKIQKTEFITNQNGVGIRLTFN